MPSMQSEQFWDVPKVDWFNHEKKISSQNCFVFLAGGSASAYRRVTTYCK